MLRLFTQHPGSVDETYLEHAAFAAGFSGKLFLAAGAAAVHAVFPFLFEKTASRITAELYNRTHNRGAPAAPEPQTGRPA
ncbi:MAG: DUF6356 family protein [Pseudomonadota bacterium]